MANQEVRNLIEEIAQLSQAELQPAEFYSQVLGRVAPRLRAEATAVWTCSDQTVELLCQSGLDGSALFHDRQTKQQHAILLESVRQSGQPRLIYPGQNGTALETTNPTEYLLGICPVKVGDRVVSLIEAFQTENGHPAHSEAGLKLLAVVAGLATNFHRNLELRWWRRLDTFSQTIHKSLHPAEAAYTIANDGRRVIGCDRLSVLTLMGRKCRALAISGQESVNRRANSVRLLERLAARALAVGEPLIYPEPTAELPPQLEQAVHAYVDESQSRLFYVRPLSDKPASSDEPKDRHTSSKIIGAIVAEQFSGTSFDFQSVEMVGHHASAAIRNALEHHRIFLLPLWSAIGKMGWLVRARTLPKTLAVVALLIGLVLAAILVPAEFKLIAEGTLQPESRRFVFARTDGTINDLQVKEGKLVKQNDILATMEKTDIDVAITQVEGQIKSRTLDLLAKKQMRMKLIQNPRRDPAEEYQLSAQEEELRELLNSLEEQRKLLLQQKDDLTIRSPVNGEVVTAKIEELLKARPVNRGDIVMTVAELDGPWVLELLLPDRRVGHFQDAQRELKAELEVSYILATNPDKTLYGKIKKVDKASRLDEKEGLGVPVIVEINKRDIQHLQLGAKVIGRIHCGKRSIGYVWVHEAVEYVQAHFLFRFF